MPDILVDARTIFYSDTHREHTRGTGQTTINIFWGEGGGMVKGIGELPCKHVRA